MTEPKSLGQIAYEAWEAFQNRDYCWEKVAEAVRVEVLRRQQHDEAKAAEQWERANPGLNDPTLAAAHEPKVYGRTGKEWVDQAAAIRGNFEVWPPYLPGVFEDRDLNRIVKDDGTISYERKVPFTSEEVQFLRSYLSQFSGDDVDD